MPPSPGGSDDRWLPSLAFEARVGYQFTLEFGLAASGVALGSPSIFPLVGLLSIGVLGEYTLLDHLTIGLGPGVGVGLWRPEGPVGDGPGGANTSDFGAIYEVALRLTYAFGARDNNGRGGGFSLGLSSLLVLASAPSPPWPPPGFTVMLAFGYDTH